MFRPHDIVEALIEKEGITQPLYLRVVQETDANVICHGLNNDSLLVYRFPRQDLQVIGAAAHKPNSEPNQTYRNRRHDVSESTIYPKAEWGEL